MLGAAHVDVLPFGRHLAPMLFLCKPSDAALGLRLVGKAAQSALPGHVLQGAVEFERVSRLHPVAGFQVGVVHHHMRVRYPVGVVVVVYDGYLVVAEEAERPVARNPA